MTGTTNLIEERRLLASAYREFNARNMEAVLACLHPGVEWANGMEGGHVHGRGGVRDYWTRQWAILDPHVLACPPSIPFALAPAGGPVALRVRVAVPPSAAPFHPFAHRPQDAGRPGRLPYSVH